MIIRNWKCAPLSVVCEINPGKKELLDKSKDMEVSFLPMAAVSVDGKILNLEKRKLKEVIKGYTNFRDGDVLLAKITPCFENGKRAIAKDLINGVGFGSTEFHVLRPKDEVTSDWIFHAISRSDFCNIAKSQMTGTAGQKRVPSRVLEQFEIPIPSRKEQDRISDNIETQFTRLEASIKLLRTIKIKLKLYRKSILNAAFDGCLSKNKITFEEKLIEDISKIKGGKRLPQGQRVQNEPTPFPYIRVTDFENYSVNTQELKFITEIAFKKISRYVIYDNEVFISIAGTIGRVGIIPSTLNGANLTENAAKLTDLKGLLPKYLMYYLSSPKAAELISFSTKSTSQPKLALFRIGNLKIQYPSIKRDQQQIVDEIELQFSVIDKIELVVDNSLAKAEILRKSILKFAFEGKLIKEL